MITDEADEVIEEVSKSLLNRYQNYLKDWCKRLILLSIMFIYCIIDVIKQMRIMVAHI